MTERSSKNKKKSKTGCGDARSRPGRSRLSFLHCGNKKKKALKQRKDYASLIGPLVEGRCSSYWKEKKIGS